MGPDLAKAMPTPHLPIARCALRQPPWMRLRELLARCWLPPHSGECVGASPLGVRWQRLHCCVHRLVKVGTLNEENQRFSVTNELERCVSRAHQVLSLGCDEASLSIPALSLAQGERGKGGNGPGGASHDSIPVKQCPQAEC